MQAHQAERADAHQFAASGSFAGASACPGIFSMIRQLLLITVQKSLAVEQSPEQILSSRCARRRPRDTSSRLPASAW